MKTSMPQILVLGVKSFSSCLRHLRSRPCVQRGSLGLAVGVVVGLAPLTQITGDYHEMGSILVTRAASWCGAIDYDDARRLRSDDVLRLFDELKAKPLPRRPALVWTLVAASCLMALVLALLTHHAGRLCSRTIRGSGAQPVRTHEQ